MTGQAYPDIFRYMKQTLKNNLLTVEIDSHGAELQSIVDNRTRHDYLYHGDSPFWGRRSPVLFPIVGSVWNGRFQMDGKVYEMGQHGFARDSDFSVVEDAPEDEAWFVLESGETTRSNYPRDFRLEIGYQLVGERLRVMWRVTNTDDKEMSFQIGAHPAFNYPDFKATDPVHAYLAFDRNELTSQLIEEKGCVGEKVMPVTLDDNVMLPVTADTFDINTIILADSQVRRVSVLDKHRNPYLSLLFSAPVVGIWSPSPEAPFICVEPWYGRADRVAFDGEFSEREYVNTLAPGKVFEASYMIIFENI